MSDQDAVDKFVSRLAPEAVCNDCIAGKLNLPDQMHSDQATRMLAGANGFERIKDRCSICGLVKLVIRKRR
jgi:hypothetical protein